MKCEQIQNRIIDYIDSSLDEQEMQEVQKHIDQCEKCREAFIETENVFHTINKVEDERPPQSLKASFYQVLEQEKASQNGGVSASFRKTRYLFNWSSMAAAAQILLLLGLGFLSGYFASSPNENEQQIDALQQQVYQLNQSLNYTLLNKPTASRRIKAINFIQTNSRVPNEKMIDALINTMNGDDNVNVRLTAIYALTDYQNIPKVKNAFIESLSKQQDPILQISLINVLIPLNDSKIRPALQKIVNSKEVVDQVKEQAKLGLAYKL